MFDFANLLLSGKCNARCPFCIGSQVDGRLNHANLDEYPPRNLDRFIELIKQQGIRQLVLTGTNTDPQLYRHEARLLEHLRDVLPAGVQIALHTNGRMALRKMAIFNLYDRAAISLPSFDQQTYRRMMGVAGVPSLDEIMASAKIQLKISCVVTDDNAAQIGGFLERCREIGIRRVVLRKLYGEKRSWHELLSPALKPESLASTRGCETLSMVLAQIGQASYRGNPLVELPGMQLTLWDFLRTQSSSLNLFSSGLISDRYLLAQAS